MNDTVQGLIPGDGIDGSFGCGLVQYILGYVGMDWDRTIEPSYVSTWLKTTGKLGYTSKYVVQMVGASGRMSEAPLTLESTGNFSHSRGATNVLQP